MTGVLTYDIMFKQRIFKIETGGGGSIMLKILNEDVMKTNDEIEEQYRDCKYLYIIDSYEKLAEHSGYLYCVSTSKESYAALYETRDRLRNEGKLCVVGGSYNNGGAIGVQYEYKGQ